jgi:UDP-N-acetylglucosamine:LPS N-acetylglucosamine transferase
VSATNSANIVGDAGTAYASVGYTSEGLDITVTPEYLDVEVDQVLDSAALFKTSQTMTVATSFTEATLENLAFVLGQPTSTVTGAYTAADDAKVLTITGGSLGAEPLERSFLAVGPGPRTANTAGLKVERLYYAPRVLSVESVSVAVKRNEATVFPVTFRCMPDSNGDYGKVVDRIYGS